MLLTRKAEVEALRKALANACKLIGIEKTGSELTLTFQRGGECFEIQAYAALSIDVTALRKAAGLSK